MNFWVKPSAHVPSLPINDDVRSNFLVNQSIRLKLWSCNTPTDKFDSRAQQLPNQSPHTRSRLMHINDSPHPVPPCLGAFVLIYPYPPPQQNVLRCCALFTCQPVHPPLIASDRTPTKNRPASQVLTIEAIGPVSMISPLHSRSHVSSDDGGGRGGAVAS